jgi:hypothetical protein
MRKWMFFVTILGILPMTLTAANLKIVPTTTLKYQLSNNTSTPDSFPNQTNGNMGATHISKIDVHSMLYSGSDTKVYAHLMPWFGDPRHMKVGYNSQDPAQIHRQIGDMISRGINGVVIDWYGSRDTFTNITTLRIMKEVEQHPGFTFAIMVDKGAIKLSACPGCTEQQTLIEQLHYVERTFVPSHAYMRIGGRPVITNFDVELRFPVDWKAAAAALSTHPVLLFENAAGFTHEVTGGSYAWVRPTTKDLGMSYMTQFYDAGLLHPNLHTVGAAYKGFDDTLASWSLQRIMPQQCGQTWLKTFAKANGMYNSTKQLDSLQLVTWNDYEEGTEIESGIDNCLAVSASLSGSSLQWSISGHENTIDHYVVYASTDGQNLMPLQTLPTGHGSMNLCSYSLGAGNYVFYVQAVGRSMMRSHMSHAINYSPHCSASSASLSLEATPSELNLKHGSSVISDVTITPLSGSIQTSVALSCSDVPDGIVCSFEPPSVIPGDRPSTSKLTVSAVSSVSSNSAAPPAIHAQYALSFSLFGIVGMAVSINGSWLKRKRIRPRLLLGVLLLGACVLSACGGGGSSADSSLDSPAGRFTITVNGTSDSGDASVPVLLTIR